MLLIQFLLYCVSTEALQGKLTTCESVSWMTDLWTASLVSGSNKGCLHLTLRLCRWVTSTSSKLESWAGMWAEGRRAGFGCRLHTSSGMFAGWAALPWQAQKNKLGQMVTWRNREKTTWKIKCFIFVFLSLLLMPVWIFLPVKTLSIGNHLQHVLGEGSFTWQFHAWMECSCIGSVRERWHAQVTYTGEWKLVLSR